MSRNTDSHFGEAPQKNIKRSSFKRPFSHKTTFNTGDIVPIYADEVLPGDTVKLHTASLVRGLTPITPVMDNAWMDIYYFFIPRRLTWKHWKEFMGENTTDAWTQTTQYAVPKLVIPTGGWNKGSLGEKLYGIQGRAGGAKVDAQYARSYVLCFNEWFRNENLIEPAAMSTDDADTTGTNGNDYVVDMECGGVMGKATKYADYFTRALPEPQKGPDIYLPLGTSAPVFAGPDEHNIPSDSLLWKNASTNTRISADRRLAQDSNGNTRMTSEALAPSDLLGGISLAPSNLYTDLELATAATINELRQAFAIQRMYEIDARGGTRYTEILRAHFGIISPDRRQQRPEYLGGKRIPINIQSVSDTAGGTNPIGTQGANSLTIDNHDDFTKSFDEHGIILGLAVIRTEHTYQQGIERKFSRTNREDFYWPALSNIGEQSVLQKEIFADGTSADDDVFGYQERWAEYRYANNRITGELNSDYAQSLDIWHYGDDYSVAPTLSKAWVIETAQNVARTVAITTQDQWKADFYFDQTWVRPMPIYSIPSMTSWN